ncbi:uncharacterized protein LOC144821551 isoform X2 [Lissotriton helveticus]
MAGPLVLLLLACCCLYTPCYTDDRRGDTSRGAPQGAEVVLGTRGESASFPAGPFKDYCEWSFLGQDKSAPQGKDVIYSDGRTCPDQVFDHYRGRVKPTCSGAFLLQHVLSGDAGFYRLQCDEQPTRYYHLRVVDPVCNVSFVRLHSENGVLLCCNSTGSGGAIAWTRDGSSLPESHLLTENHTLSIPRGVACGCYQCSVVCGVLGQLNATINLTSPDASSLIYCPLMIEILAVEGVYAAAFGVQCILTVGKILGKAKAVSGDPMEVQQNTINSETTSRTQGATYCAAVQIALKLWHWVVMFLSSLCYWTQESRRDWKSIDLTPVGTVLALSLLVEIGLFIINRMKFFKAEVRRRKKLRNVCSVIPWGNALLQHIFVILGAAYSLTVCFNLRCMHVKVMSWGYALPIVFVPFGVLLVGAILYKRCTAYSKASCLEPEAPPGQGVNKEDSGEDLKAPCLGLEGPPTHGVNMEDTGEGAP